MNTKKILNAENSALKVTLSEKTNEIEELRKKLNLDDAELTNLKAEKTKYEDNIKMADDAIAKLKRYEESAENTPIENEKKTAEILKSIKGAWK